VREGEGAWRHTRGEKVKDTFGGTKRAKEIYQIRGASSVGLTRLHNRELKGKNRQRRRQIISSSKEKRKGKERLRRKGEGRGREKRLQGVRALEFEGKKDR